MDVELSPALLLSAYAQGIFPMADDDEEVYWFSPDPRAIIDLEEFRPSRSLRKAYERGSFEYCVDRDFEAVIDCCADREEGTWISDEIREAYVELHRLGFAHSVETRQDGGLVGGLYGVSLGGAFFGESMFHKVTNASKVALVYLIERMKRRGFVLLDVQFSTEHLESLGCSEIPRGEYLDRLENALQLKCRFAD